MSKLLKCLQKITVSSLIIIGLVVAGSYVTVQATSGQGNENKLAYQIKRLANAIDKFAEALNPSEQISGDDSGLSAFGGFQLSSTNYDEGVTCLRGYETWPTSDTRKTDADWSPYEFVAHSSTIPALGSRLIDLNGDGLLDYLYSYNTDYSYTLSGVPHYFTSESSCVMINTGKGWEVK